MLFEYSPKRRSSMENPLFAKKSVKVLLEEMEGENRLRRVLGPIQLSSLGVGAIIGTGIFVLTGIAAHDKTGPALMLSFVVAGLACIFAALCYAEFASMVPVAGSAYTYAYATLGELCAWIVGWDLILEYAVGSATVAHGWSHYFQDFIGIFSIRIPFALTNAPFDFDPATGILNATGKLIDFPALVITAIVTTILVKGIRESASFNAAMVGIKLAIVLVVIAVGAMYVDSRNWHPFAPYGLSGVAFFGQTIMGQTGRGGEPLGMLAGAATIFFAYIGFDSVSTHAEEARNPRRDVPIGILISLGALTGITSVLLVLMLSQPRVMLAMARDRLIPQSFFGAVHARFRTPWKSTILTGCFVGILASFLPLRILAELVNIGTLLAFIIVCAAVLIMRRTNPELHRPFKAPLFPFVPIAGIAICLLLMLSLPSENWYRLIIWLIIGFCIYFTYGRKHSALRQAQGQRVGTV